MTVKTADIRMIDGKRFVSADDAVSIIDTLTKLLQYREPDEFRHFTILCGPDTKCEIKFTGPVSIAEFDSLLAHIAFYKTFIPEEPRAKHDLRREILDTLKPITIDQSDNDREAE